MSQWYGSLDCSPVSISLIQTQLTFAPGSPERAKLQEAIRKMKEKVATDGPFKVPCFVNGQDVRLAIIFKYAYTNSTTPVDHAVIESTDITVRKVFRPVQVQ